MTPVEFKQANTTFGPPPDMTDSQCATIHAFKGEVHGGSLDGVEVVIVAWQPSGVDMARIMAGDPVFLTVCGGLPPHLLATSFEEAVRPA